MRPEQRRHFGARLGEAEDVVDEEQHVLALVAEIFGDGETGERDAHARARRLVHLAEDEGAFRLHGRVGIVRIGVDVGLDELVIEVVAFAGALANAREHRIAAMGLGDVVDELLNQHRLADARAAEETDLAALGVGRKQVDDLDAGDQNLRFGRLLDVRRGRLMDRAARVHRNGTGFVDGLADDVHDAPERAGADRNRDRSAGVGHFLAAHQTFGDVHRDAAHGVFAKVLGDFENQTRAIVGCLERVENRRQVAVEFHVDDGADHLGDAAGGICDIRHFDVLVLRSSGRSTRRVD